METSDAASGVLKQHFDRHRAQLSRSELAVAEYLVALPIDVLIFKSAEEIASDAGTSDATVIRTARRLGFSGLPELKRICSRAMARTIPTSDRLEQRFRGTGSFTLPTDGRIRPRSSLTSRCFRQPFRFLKVPTPSGVWVWEQRRWKPATAPSRSAAPG